MAKNTIVAVGSHSEYMCFLNVELEEAIRRYKEEYRLPTESLKYTVTTIEFDDVFEVNADYPFLVKGN